MTKRFKVGDIVKIVKVDNKKRRYGVIGFGELNPPHYLNDRIGIVTNTLDIKFEKEFESCCEMEFFSVELDGMAVKKIWYVLLEKELAEVSPEEKKKFEEINEQWEAHQLAMRL